ncbi:hypothetical protein FOC1_g10007443 [Fusarium oxysporum f. sp. cubense race 1]|uniref:Uncharacterized protein n=1 Tax=Fusarium oxysporum f. sp. cubense (strain race 1) TaxID=1229664 RepID=N4U5U8_FUSC1|nr:hypothetical protein FOC1_g10007443 [Fusarium oxysporum f. sp. cubense race 1]
MIKSLALNLLLTLGSVAASQPQSENGLSARADPFTCGNLAVKVKWINKCICTDIIHATIDSSGKFCTCDSGYKQSGNKCVKDCGDDANFGYSSTDKKWACHCKNKWLTYSNKACACPDSQTDDGVSACVDKCPGATYTVDGSSYKCECSKDSQKWDTGSLSCVDKCPASITDYNTDGSCTCKDPDFKYSGGDNGDCDTKKCPVDGTKYDGDDKGQPKCPCTDSKKKLNGAGDACELKCPVSGSDYTGQDDGEGAPICKCNDPSMKLDGGACVPKCDSDSTFVKDGDNPGDDPVCDKKCPNGGTEFVKDGDNSGDPPVCKCTDEAYTINDQLKCDKKCPEDGTTFVKDGDNASDPPVCKCDDESLKINGQLKCDKKCPTDGTTFVKDGDNAGDPPVCKCDDDSLIINDQLTCDPKCSNPDTEFVKDGDAGQPAECKCKDDKKYLDGSNSCKNKCPDGATYDDSGSDWTCNCPNVGEHYTKATADAGPKCACDDDKQVVPGDNKCTSKCPAGATYTPDNSEKGYTCGCDAAIAGSNYDSDNNKCTCPTTNSDGFTIKLNDNKDKCIIDCGTEASLSSDEKSCVCTLAEGTKFDKSALKCPCDAPDYKAFKGKCIPDCGSAAYWNHKTVSMDACVCKKRGQTFTKDGKTCACDGSLVWSDGSCHKDCGKDAHWDSRRNDCVCEKRGQLFNDNGATCSCPTAKPIWDGSRCVPDCGDYASYNYRAGVCVCDKKGKVFTASNKSCDCPAPQVWLLGKCQVDCGSDAGWDKRTQKCVCYKSGQLYDNGSCACPADKPAWSSKYKCYKPKA